MTVLAGFGMCVLAQPKCTQSIGFANVRCRCVQMHLWLAVESVQCYQGNFKEPQLGKPNSIRPTYEFSVSHMKPKNRGLQAMHRLN